MPRNPAPPVIKTSGFVVAASMNTASHGSARRNIRTLPPPSRCLSLARQVPDRYRLTLVNAPTSFFALRESRALAARVAESARLPLGALEERDFEGGEFKLRPLQSVRDRPTCVFQCLAGTQPAPSSERLLKLLFLL